MLFISLSDAAQADAFVPTMISANILWFFVLPVIVALEGWLMARQKWQEPYWTALKGNLWSMAAALPLQVVLSILGGYVAERDTLAFIPYNIRFFLAQVLLYGQAYDARDIFLAPIIFIGICWAFSVAVEGYYYSLRNPLLPRKKVYRTTVIVHIISYLLLLALWLPYLY